MKQYKILKVINNSAIMATDGKDEVILLGKGIGFSCKEHDVIEESSKIEKKFIHIDASKWLPNARDHQMLPFIATVIEVMDKYTENDFSFSTLKSLTEHIAAMYLRIINQENISNPFHYETKSLYANDYVISRKVCEEIYLKTGIRIPDSEVDFLTLYIHYANNNTSKSKTDLVHSIIYQVSCILTDKHHLEFDKDSLDYSRFVVHLRFVIERVMRSEKITSVDLDGIKMERFQAYNEICDDIIQILEEELNTKISDGERIYLLLHLARLNMKKQ